MESKLGMVKMSHKDILTKDNSNKDILDLAASLAREIKNSKEYGLYCEARQKLFDDKKQTQMLAEYRRQQLKMQFANMIGEAYEEENGGLEELYHAFINNEAISDFLYAESRFTRLLNDVQNILGKNLDLWVEVGFEEEEEEAMLN